MATELKTIPDFKTAKLPYVFRKPRERDLVLKVIFLDTETTGLNPAADKLISLGMVKCSYNYDRDLLLSVDELFQEFEDPGFPLPKNIIELTGLHDEDLHLKGIPVHGFWDFIEGAQMVVAHNAEFDRSFLEHFFFGDKRLLNIPWACSLKEPNWSVKLKENHLLSLPKLLAYVGYKYRAHDSLEDALALMWLMHLKPSVFSNLLTAVRHRARAERNERLNIWRNHHE